MAVKKLNSRTMLYSQLLSQDADNVRRSAAKAVRAARGEIHRSKSLVARSREVVEKTARDLSELKARREQRAKKKGAEGKRES
jgi:tRNA A37 N6-isopentenylltransferase MiaA